MVEKWTAAVEAWKAKHPEAGTWRLFGRAVGVGTRPTYLAMLELENFASFDKQAESYAKYPDIRAAEAAWGPMIDDLQSSVMELLSEVE